MKFSFQAHLAPDSETKFDFQKYISRSLEEDFKVVVGIRLVLSSALAFFSYSVLILENSSLVEYTVVLSSSSVKLSYFS